MSLVARFANPFAGPTDLLVFADALEESGHEGRADEYRRVAAAMEKDPRFTTELNDVLTLPKLLDRTRHGRPEHCRSYVRFLRTALEDPKGRGTDGRMAFLVTEGEKKRLRRTRRTPERWADKYDSCRDVKPFPVDQVWPGQYGPALRFTGTEVSRAWPDIPPSILVRLDGYTVWAYQFGFLCRRHPTATWHEPRFETGHSPLGLVANGRIVAVVMPQHCD